ncbi:Hypothetical predicted protein [Octopus vulgaris]|uniref:Uncharacterized protein n=1 Tax=Octopus vulgaris TaxID=6645 RepID=A0AA36BBW7_OCTVU|nr:Hypothetical predicted protein [Octopus vulgaris]
MFMTVMTAAMSYEISNSHSPNSEGKADRVQSEKRYNNKTVRRRLKCILLNILFICVKSELRNIINEQNRCKAPDLDDDSEKGSAKEIVEENNKTIAIVI